MDIYLIIIFGLLKNRFNSSFLIKDCTFTVIFFSNPKSEWEKMQTLVDIYLIVLHDAEYLLS